MLFNRAILLTLIFLTSPLWGMQQYPHYQLIIHYKNGTICGLWNNPPITYTSNGTVQVNTYTEINCITTNNGTESASSFPYHWAAMPLDTLHNLLDKKISNTLVPVSPIGKTLNLPCSLSEDPFRITHLCHSLNAEEEAFKKKPAYNLNDEQTLLNLRVLKKQTDDSITHGPLGLGKITLFNTLLGNRNLFTHYMLIRKASKQQLHAKIVPSYSATAIMYDQNGIPTSHEHIENMHGGFSSFCYLVPLSMQTVKLLLESDREIVHELCLSKETKTFVDLHIRKPDDLQELSSLQHMYTSREAVFFSRPSLYIKESEQDLIEKKVLNRLDDGTYTHGPLGLGKIVPFKSLANNKDLFYKCMLLLSIREKEL